MKASSSQIVFSCEHGGNRVPREFQHLFINQKEKLKSHLGYDKGALNIARKLSRRLQWPLKYSTTTRLLIDLNRSTHHPKFFSELTRPCDHKVKTRIIERYYLPYHAKLDRLIKATADKGQRVIHFSIHSFTPVLNGKNRNADIGLLYNPARPREKFLAQSLRTYIRKHSNYRVRMNYPYLGKADGMTTILRKRHVDRRYSGIEIELNQALFRDYGDESKAILDLLAAGIKTVLVQTE